MHTSTSTKTDDETIPVLVSYKAFVNTKPDCCKQILSVFLFVSLINFLSNNNMKMNCICCKLAGRPMSLEMWHCAYTGGKVVKYTHIIQTALFTHVIHIFRFVIYIVGVEQSLDRLTHGFPWIRAIIYGFTMKLLHNPIWQVPNEHDYNWEKGVGISRQSLNTMFFINVWLGWNRSIDTQLK